MAAGCGGGGGSSTPPPSGGVPTAAVTITPTNAAPVAKGAMTPSQTAVKTGSSGATAVGVVVQAGAPRSSVMDVALAQLKRVQGTKVPAAPAVVVGASLAPFPVTFGCGAYSNTSTLNGGTPNTTSGTVMMDIQGTNVNNVVNITSATLTYSSCVETNPAAIGATTTLNGSMTLSIGSMTGLGTSGSPLVESVSMSFSNFSSVDAIPGSPANTLNMSGGMTMAISDNGTTLTATMSGTSFAMTSSVDGAFTMKNFLIVDTQDSPTAVTPTGNYSFTVAMTTNCAALGGDIVITTTTPFTGTGTANPTAGVMKVSGANGSYLTITANANNTATVAVNDGTTATQPVSTQTLTWAQI